MFEKVKKNMPAGIILVGIFISVIMVFLSRCPTQGYHAILTKEALRECAMVVLTECLAGAAAFKILIKKEKSEGPGFPQK